MPRQTLLPSCWWRCSQLLYHIHLHHNINTFNNTGHHNNLDSQPYTRTASTLTLHLPSTISMLFFPPQVSNSLEVTNVVMQPVSTKAFVLLSPTNTSIIGNERDDTSRVSFQHRIFPISISLTIMSYLMTRLVTCGLGSLQSHAMCSLQHQ